MMNKERYLELISDNLYDCFRMCKVPLDKGIFMQDGATCHTVDPGLELSKKLRLKNGYSRCYYRNTITF